MCVRVTLFSSSYDCFLNISLWSQTDFSLRFHFTMFLYVELGGHGLAHRSCLMLGIILVYFLASAMLLKGMSSKFYEQRFCLDWQTDSTLLSDDKILPFCHASVNVYNGFFLFCM